MYLQLPKASAVTVAASGVPSIVKWTVALASPEPASAGLLVTLSVLEMPVSLTRLSVTAGDAFATKRSWEPKLSWTIVPDS